MSERFLWTIQSEDLSTHRRVLMRVQSFLDNMRDRSNDATIAFHPSPSFPFMGSRPSPFITIQPRLVLGSRLDFFAEQYSSLFGSG